ncbi:MAG: hypothetical protein JJE51_05830 [Thermoanaerobaculia bacterium]|nr:hypothetical protein [Thermoanaerobaculia bacterium]
MRDTSERVAFFAGVVALGVVMRLVQATWLQPLNWDEIEFFRATNWVWRGLVPFRDFWEHHTPLQWFLFAPVAAFVKGHSTNAIIAMRWAQVPLWLLTFWIAMRWMRDLGIGRFARWATLALAISSTLLMLPAIEYRVDVLGCTLYLGGLLLLQRLDRRAAFLAGVLFCLAGFANLRLGPLLAITVLLNRVVNRRDRKWGGPATANWVFAGVIAMLALAGIYFAATHSLEPLFRHVWYENYLGDKFAPRIPLAFVHRLILPFGLRVYGGGSFWDWERVDLSGAMILLLGFIGIGRALARWRAPDQMFFAASLQITSMLFIATMKFVYHYHFLIVVLMMLPFAAAEIERFAMAAVRRRLLIGYVAVAAIASAVIVLFRGKERDFAYQDLIMREVHRRTAAGARVFDGVGWALRREPAYRFWFLPDLVRQLVYHRHVDGVRISDWQRNPPAAIITDRNSAVFLAQNPELGIHTTRHYLPLWRNLWLPGLSARITPQSPTAEWVAPADGRFRVAASRALAGDPWFRQPLAYGVARAPIEVSRLPNDAAMTWTVNGAMVELSAGRITLRKGDRVRATLSGDAPAGVMLFPGDDSLWFMQPPAGVTIDSEGARFYHRPEIGYRISAPTPTSSARP